MFSSEQQFHFFYVRTFLSYVGNLAVQASNNIPIPHIKLVPEPLWCVELECYCCNQLAYADELRTNITEDRP